MLRRHRMTPLPFRNIRLLHRLVHLLDRNAKLLTEHGPSHRSWHHHLDFVSSGSLPVFVIVQVDGIVLVISPSDGKGDSLRDAGVISGDTFVFPNVDGGKGDIPACLGDGLAQITAVVVIVVVIVVARVGPAAAMSLGQQILGASVTRRPPIGVHGSPLLQNTWNSPPVLEPRLGPAIGAGAGSQRQHRFLGPGRIVQNVFHVGFAAGDSFGRRLGGHLFEDFAALGIFFGVGVVGGGGAEEFGHVDVVGDVVAFVVLGRWWVGRRGGGGGGVGTPGLGAVGRRRSEGFVGVDSGGLIALGGREGRRGEFVLVGVGQVAVVAFDGGHVEWQRRWSVMAPRIRGLNRTHQLVPVQLLLDLARRTSLGDLPAATAPAGGDARVRRTGFHGRLAAR
mmetsp:Transcript_21626/g.44625  ORF Transcript_21626/g.44625 Transcript_21626/m.44625 type:complete len:393 (-) Transcript_21626:393-1571(-)